MVRPFAESNDGHDNRVLRSPFATKSFNQSVRPSVSRNSIFTVDNTRVDTVRTHHCPVGLVTLTSDSVIFVRPGVSP